MAAPFLTSASSEIGVYMFLFFKEAFALGDCQALLEAAFIQMSWMEYKRDLYKELEFSYINKFPISYHLYNFNFPTIFSFTAKIL